MRNIILKRVVFRLLKLVQNRDPSKTLRITDYTPEVRQSEGEGKRYVNNPDELQRFKYKDELIFCKGFNVFRCNKFDYELHPEAKKLEYEKAIEHVPEWRKREEPYQLYVLRYIPGTEAFDRKHLLQLLEITKNIR